VAEAVGARAHAGLVVGARVALVDLAGDRIGSAAAHHRLDVLLARVAHRRDAVAGDVLVAEQGQRLRSQAVLALAHDDLVDGAGDGEAVGGEAIGHAAAGADRVGGVLLVAERDELDHPGDGSHHHHQGGDGEGAGDGDGDGAVHVALSADAGLGGVSDAGMVSRSLAGAVAATSAAHSSRAATK
jgi:hypothetical protein